MVAMTPEIRELERIREQLAATVAESVEWPHASFTFDIEGRRGNPLRIFRTIAQNTQLHSEHFRAATRWSHLAILDAY